MKKAFLSMLMIGSSCALFAQVEQTTKDTVPNATVTPTAPTSQPDDKTTLKSTGQYSAYSAVVAVPPNIQTNFNTNFPGVSDVRWEQNKDWYRATYTMGARRMRMMYDNRGNSFALALPVSSGLVSDEVIEKAYTLYGDNIYDITRLMLAPPKPESNMMTTTMGPESNMANANVNANANVSTDTAVSANANAAVSGNANMMTAALPPRGVIYQVRIIENGEIRTERMNEDGTAYTEAYWRVPDEQQMPMDQGVSPAPVAPADSLQQTAPADTSTMQQQDSTMHDQQGALDNPDKSDSDTSQPDPDAPQSDSSQKSDATLPSSPKKEQ